MRLLEAGGERAEAELVAAEVLELLRAGVPGEEIVVVHRSPAAAARLSSACSSSTGSRLPSTAGSRSATPPLGRGLLALARCALLGERARAEDLLDYLRAPGLLDRPEIADGLEAERSARGTADRGRRRASAARLDARRDRRARVGGSTRAAELACQARRLFAAPHRGRAPVLGAAEELDARALSTMVRALAELEELGERLSRARS